MLTVLENVALADEKDMMVCQDTGLPIYKVMIGNKLAERGLDLVEIKKRLKLATERATREYPLRSNSVHPITRKNTQTNTGQGLPIIKPPYGRINAIDLDTGNFLWQVPHGETPEAVKNHPALKGLDIPRTGRNGAIGTLVTKTLVIAGEPGYGPTPSGARGSMLRAYDKRSGADAGAVYLPAPQSGSPMTYMLNGRQYLVLAISGGNYSGELVALALPK
jgi:glucose dehydrogenase